MMMDDNETDRTLSRSRMVLTTYGGVKWKEWP